MARSEETDARLVEPFDRFYLREFPKMVAIAAAVTGNRLIAEDLAQEAMVRTHRDWRRIGAFDKPGAWTRRVTINLANSALRRKKSEAKARLKLSFNSGGTIAGPSVDDKPIWDAVRTLPAKQRAAVALFYLEDRSVSEIATILECTAATAKVHLHRGRQTLSERIAHPGAVA